MLDAGPSILAIVCVSAWNKDPVFGAIGIQSGPPGQGFAGFEGTDYFAIFCSTANDCSYPASWGNEQKLTETSFNILDAPVARGHFLGDYMGLAASGPATVYSVFGIATGQNTTAEFTRKISGLP
jgi:hypothetical protein